MGTTPQATTARDRQNPRHGGCAAKKQIPISKLAKRLRAGSVWVNCYNVFDAALPFGGYKQSGWGREMGREVLDLYTQAKAVTTQL